MSRFSDNTAHAILRIVRELVANATRHGRATSVEVRGDAKDGNVSFSVADNGCGFDPKSVPGVSQGHFGLQGIRERVAELKGLLSIESSPGKGTTTTVTFNHQPL
jgi:signal transduction histidine kinase